MPSTPSRSLQIRHPLSPRPRDRPPPDSPVDVAHSRSGLGFPDGEDDDDELEEDTDIDEDEDAYVDEPAQDAHASDVDMADFFSDESEPEYVGKGKGKATSRASAYSSMSGGRNPPVMLISLKAGALGLNLTVANNVYLCVDFLLRKFVALTLWNA